MAITNSGELETAVQDWLDRNDITGYAADYVTLAQGYLNMRLRCRQMVTTGTLSPTSGVFTLPSDYLQYRSIVEDASDRRSLEFITLDEAEEIYPDRPSGLGIHFTILGSDLRVYPTISNDIILTYYAKLGAFSQDSDTDWLLTAYPHIYLLGAKAFAYDFIDQGNRMAESFARLEAEIDQLNGQDMAAEFASAPLHIEGSTP